MSNVLVTGGAGYIGTHILTVLAAAGHRCVVVDNYSNSSPRAIERVRALVPAGAVDAHDVDIRDAAGLKRVFERHPIDSVIHMAGSRRWANPWNSLGATTTTTCVAPACCSRRCSRPACATSSSAPRRIPMAIARACDLRRGRGEVLDRAPYRAGAESSSGRTAIGGAVERPGAACGTPLSAGSGYRPGGRFDPESRAIPARFATAEPLRLGSDCSDRCPAARCPARASALAGC